MDDFMNTVTEKIVPEAIRLIIVIVLAALCFFLIKRFTKFIARPAHLSKLSPSVKTFLVSFLSDRAENAHSDNGASMLGVPMASVVAVSALRDLHSDLRFRETFKHSGRIYDTDIQAVFPSGITSRSAPSPERLLISVCSTPLFSHMTT